MTPVGLFAMVLICPNKVNSGCTRATWAEEIACSTLNNSFLASSVKVQGEERLESPLSKLNKFVISPVEIFR